MSNWKEYKLGEIIKVKHGYAFKGAFFSKEPTDDILLSPGNFNIGGGFKSDKFKYYNGAYPESYILKEGDIIVTMTDLSKEGDTLGYSAKIPPHKGIKYLHNQRLGLLELIDNDFNIDFLYWLLRTREYQQFIVSSATGTTVKHTAPTRICEYAFKAPDYDTQTAIAEILSSLDDKIELNNKINQELENLAQTLFKQWFIDFEFPANLVDPALSGDEGYKSSGGEMVESELGEIPKGWEISTINDITEKVTKGTTPTTIGGKFTDSGINFIKVESLTEQGAFIKSKFGFIDEETNQLLKRSIIQEGDVLFSIAGTIGRVAVVTKDILPANTNQAIAIIRPNQVDSNFLKLLMKSALIQNDTKSNVVQAVQANLSLGVIKATKFIKPPFEILLFFKSTLSGVFENINLLTEENQELTHLRDTLLPKLISGELEVKNVKI